MVSKRLNVSAYDGMPPSDDTVEDRLIQGDIPLYLPEEIVEAAQTKTIPWTKKSISNIKSLELELEEVVNLVVKAVTTGRYLKSVWCTNHTKGSWAACDSYVVSDKYWNANAQKELDCEYYLKFALGKSGSLVLVVSCHVG